MCAQQMEREMKTGTRVRILSFVGAQCERDWSETGRIGRWHPNWSDKSVRPDGYFPVTFDSDGARMLVHRDRLMVCNDQSA